MTDQLAEPTAGEAVVLEDSEQDQARMRELDERIEAQGGPSSRRYDVRHEGRLRLGGDDDRRGEEAPRLPRDGRRTTRSSTDGSGPSAATGRAASGTPGATRSSRTAWGTPTTRTRDPRTAGCATGVAWFTQRGRLSQTPHVGDIVYYGPGGGTHVELVVGVSRHDHPDDRRQHVGHGRRQDVLQRRRRVPEVRAAHLADLRLRQPAVQRPTRSRTRARPARARQARRPSSPAAGR